jgi:hypothetical protein
MDRQYNDQKKHGQTIQQPNETCKKHGQAIQRPVVVLSVHVSFGRCNACPCFLHVSFGCCIACPCFFWSLYCLFTFHYKSPYYQKKHGQTIQRPKETWTDNTTTKGSMDRQYNYQKKHGQAIQRPKETWTGNTTTKRNMDRQYNDHVSCMFRLVVVLPVHVSFGRYIVCPCFFW